jgi:hypothetical protein
MKLDVKGMSDEHLANAARYHRQKATWHERVHVRVRQEIELRGVRRRWRKKKCYSQCHLCDCQ